MKAVTRVRFFTFKQLPVRSVLMAAMMFLLIFVGGRQGQGEEPLPTPTSAAATFQRLDLDQNGQLVEAELVAMAGPLSVERLQQRLRVFDGNQDGHLSLEEFLTLPGAVELSERGDVADTFASFCEGEVERLLKDLQAPVDASRLSAKWQGKLPETVPLDARHWDRDGSGTVDLDEARFGLEIAYGLRRPDGQRARSTNGFLFNGSYFDHIDENRDRQLSRAELISRHYAGEAAAKELLKQGDFNHDGKLELSEIDAAGLFQTDVGFWFLKWDSNLDGRIDAEELAQGETWQRDLARQMLPAFDTDADSHLSLEEYRHSPLANSVVNWTRQRADTDGDGDLNRSEFFAAKSLCCSGLSELYFTRLDRNHDGQLDPGEFTYRIDVSKIPLSKLLEQHDRDNDQHLTLLEIFTRKGETPLQSTQEVLIPNHITWFQFADLNGDERLSIEEFAAVPLLHRAAETERQLRRDLLPAFQKRDLDHNGTLSLEEWNTGADSSRLTSRAQEWAIGDEDADGELAFAEYASLPSISSLHQRPAVCDPVQERVLRIAGEIRKAWPAEGEALSAEAVVQRLHPHLSLLAAKHLIEWDANADRLFNLKEVQFGLLIAFGLQTASGEPLSRPNGQIFNLRAFQAADHNHDGRLSQNEFAVRYWRQGVEAERDFLQADANSDTHLSLSELLHSQLYWIDSQQEFVRFDLNSDGFLDAQELKRQARSHERRMVERLFPAFDLNRDDRLSFREFRGTPLANPIHDYDARRWDLNYDGALSLQEYHRGSANHTLLSGLTQMFFQTLDQNHDGKLTFEEYPFSADLKREPPEVVFQMLDLNLDGRLQLAELLERQKPVNGSSWAKRDAEQRSMEIEDAFLASDLNQDRTLTVEEFTVEGSTIRNSVLGLNRARPPSVPQVVRSGSFWRWTALIGLNVCLFLGIAWWKFRSH